MTATRHKLRLVLIASTIASLGGLTLAQVRAPGRAFLWTVRAPGGTSLTLVGSVHALPSSAYPLPPVFTRTFDEAATLVEEIDLGDAPTQGDAPGLFARGMFQDGRTFQSAVSADTLARVTARLRGTPLSTDTLTPLKPWMVTLLLSSLDLQRAGLDAALGLDRHFYDRARAAGKPIVGLETAESQIARLDQLPDFTQEQLLRSALTDAERAPAELAAIVSAWQTGDAPAIERQLLSSLAAHPAVYRSLIVERNKAWMARLDACLQARERCFVVVGAAHLVGPDGLLVRMRRRGYDVTQQ